MKKLYLLFSIIMLSTFTSIAQNRIGGDFGFGIQGIPDHGVSFMLNIEPRYTYALNDKWEVGASIAFGASTSLYNGNIHFDWSINPLVRFRVVEINNFGFWLEPKAGLGTSHDLDKRVNLHWGMNINPVFTYQLSERFRLDATLGFLGVGLNSFTAFYNGEAGYTYVDFGAHLANGSLTSIIEHVEAAFMYLMSNGQTVEARNFLKPADFQIGFVYMF